MQRSVSVKWTNRRRKQAVSRTPEYVLQWGSKLGKIYNWWWGCLCVHSVKGPWAEDEPLAENTLSNVVWNKLECNRFVAVPHLPPVTHCCAVLLCLIYPGAVSVGYEPKKKKKCQLCVRMDMHVSTASHTQCTRAGSPVSTTTPGIILALQQEKMGGGGDHWYWKSLISKR